MSKVSDNSAPKKEFFLLRALKKIGKFLKKHIKLIIFLIIVIAVILYVKHKNDAAAAMLAEQENQPVTAEVDIMDLQQSVSVTGTLTANETATVTSTLGSTGVTGVKVAKVNYKEGDYVEAGSVVVQFDGDDYNRKIAELNAQYNIDNVKSDIDIAELQQQIVDTQKKIDEKQQWLDDNEIIYLNLKDAFEKYEKYKNDDQSVVNRWNVESAAAAALASPVTISGYEATQKEIDELQTSITTITNKILLAELQQNYNTTYAQVDEYDKVYESMDKTQVSAPISGYILSMNVEEGNNYTQGNSVFTIADTSGFVVEATVNEYDIAKIQEDLPVIVKFEATGDEEFNGTVSFVSVASTTSVATTQTATATTSTTTSGSTAQYKIKITLDETDERLRVGMTAKASVVLNSVSNAMAVPYDCVQTADDGSFFVTVINDDGTTEDVTVTKGLESDYYVQIKGDGIEKGTTVEAVVTDAPSTNVMDYVYME